jgi:hypothetical protein
VQGNRIRGRIVGKRISGGRKSEIQSAESSEAENQRCVSIYLVEALGRFSRLVYSFGIDINEAYNR